MITGKTERCVARYLVRTPRLELPPIRKGFSDGWRGFSHAVGWPASIKNTNEPTHTKFSLKVRRGNEFTTNQKTNKHHSKHNFHKPASVKTSTLNNLLFITRMDLLCL
jgi:molecular chaperone DnaK (HSP70)